MTRNATDVDMPTSTEQPENQLPIDVYRQCKADCWRENLLPDLAYGMVPQVCLDENPGYVCSYYTYVILSIVVLSMLCYVLQAYPLYSLIVTVQLP